MAARDEIIAREAFYSCDLRFCAGDFTTRDKQYTLIMPVTHGKVLIPTCIRENIFPKLPEPESNITLLFPINTRHARILDYKTITPLISESWRGCYLNKFTLDNEPYYAAKGLITDSDFHPYIVCMNNYTFRNETYYLTSYEVHIDFSVFTDSNKVTKYILNRLLPIYASFGYNIKIYNLSNMILRQQTEPREASLKKFMKEYETRRVFLAVDEDSQQERDN